MRSGFDFKSDQRQDKFTGQLLLDTLVEIQEIAYNSEAQRTPRSVLASTTSPGTMQCCVRQLSGLNQKN
jgi:hypothetical protein